MNNEIKKFIIQTRPLYLTKTKLYNGHFYIGYSHRICLGDSLYNVNEISKSDAEYLLDRDIKKISRQFNKYIKEDKIELSINQKIALCSLIYDIGIKAFITGALYESLKEKDYISVWNMFRIYNKYKKKPIYQLIKNRKAEMELFSKELNND